MRFEILLQFLGMCFVCVHIEMSELICSFMSHTIEWTTYWMLILTQQ